MAPSYRRDEYADPSGDAAGDNPTAFPTLAASSFHSAHAPSNVPNARSNPPALEMPAGSLPRSVRNMRAVPDTSNPQTAAEGIALEPATGYSFPTAGGGAPVGTPHAPTTDPGAHAGLNPFPGRISNQAGIGTRDYGDWNSNLGGFTDPRAHEQRAGNGDVSPRHETGGYRFTTPQFDASPQVNVQREGLPVIVAAESAQALEKPISFFTQGRPAKRNLAYYERPFDQTISQRLTGDKARPTSPPSVGGQDIDATPRASLPLMTTHEDRVPGTAYNGPTFAAPGMQPAGPSKNTWRLQPQPWDENLVDTSGIG